MYTVKVKSDFSAAHNLRNYRGKCENLHGHNWKVEVGVSALGAGRDGMVIDFRKLKTALENCLKKLDHCLLNDIPYFKKKNPTSEHIAEYIYKQLAPKLKTGPLKIKEVSVWETDTSCATYEPYN